MEELDLRIQPRGCTDHPLIWLKKRMENMKTGEKIVVITDPSIIPPDAIRVMAARKNIVVEVIAETDDEIKLLVEKKG